MDWISAHVKALCSSPQVPLTVLAWLPLTVLAGLHAASDASPKASFSTATASSTKAWSGPVRSLQLTAKGVPHCVGSAGGSDGDGGVGGGGNGGGGEGGGGEGGGSVGGTDGGGRGSARTASAPAVLGAYW